MILGLGIDIVQIPRLEQLYREFDIIFIKKILSEQEISIMPSNKIAYHLAKRFAAKEALSKALGCGIGSKIRFTDIEVFNNLSGKPYFSQKTLDIASCIMGEKITGLLSIADDYPTAIAQVILLRAE
jgi:holo-[acyl-carrier protein] synthase